METPEQPATAGDPPDPPSSPQEHRGTPTPLAARGSIGARASRAWNRFARHARAQRKRENRSVDHRSPFETWLTERDLWGVGCLGIALCVVCMLALIVWAFWFALSALHGQMEPQGAPPAR